MKKLVLIFLVNLVFFVNASYPPTGDEVLPGSVLLPASRRGRYLANIVRRQAVDGTGIKFNKDADRMNAEAKKKVDVLSDELLPYIIAEQERRTTLYKRIMTAIQNGEKGVTIAEIRNKPPLLIRKGLMYRCPSNRAPKEPDGSGTLMCEEDIEPTQVMYDSCLSTEDKDLYNADGKYFFCNRHKVEGPDLPRNGSSVIGCAPEERTSLNYTTTKCALEDTEEVVVHYRYYPDRSYKFVTELDPDHEVCDHWNPCQIGYIFTLPSADMAAPANELWQDSIDEFVTPTVGEYETSPRRIPIPKGYKFSKLWARRNSDSFDWNPVKNDWNSKADIKIEEDAVTVKLKFPEMNEFFYSTYYAVFKKAGKKRRRCLIGICDIISAVTKAVKFVALTVATAIVTPLQILSSCGGGPLIHIGGSDTYGGPQHNQAGPYSKPNPSDAVQNATTDIPYRCPRCHLQSILIRSSEGHVYNLDPAYYKIKDDRTLTIDVGNLKPWQFGDFFIVTQNPEGVEERVKALTVNKIQIDRKTASLPLGAQYDQPMEWKCDNDPDCTLTDVMCNGASATASGHVAITAISKKITFSFPSFGFSDACVYMGEFKANEKLIKKILLVTETAKIKDVAKLPLPKRGEQFEHIVSYECASDCTVEKVTVNGIPLEVQQMSRRSNGGPNSGESIAFYVLGDKTITIRITEFSANLWAGVYQAKFVADGEEITKTILELSGDDKSGSGDGGSEDGAAADADVTEPAGGTDPAAEETTAAAETTVTTAAAETTETTTEPPAG
ncbi:hypothetical protein O0L34_g15841 [Tuta absoluta]|nr:hypothetical protein O0L34_g15841 [Tuta absoluta]